ncbi:transcriptional regulator [Rodentibacter caecimuris]|uniref:DNA-binding protein n=1 Tax=Rodentibacter caecimuris TaxID=1796644 RepID=A0ABX3KYZ7_9PAST|nr:DNA-binding protein [Rodentibacter heylii]
MNKAQKDYFIRLTHFLGAVLGPKYEIVFHILEKNQTSIAAIVNSHVSGRTLNSPLTSFAINMLREKIYLDKDYICNYKALVDSNKVIKGSTFFIKNGDELEGFLCINHDTAELVNAVSKLIELENLGGVVNMLGVDSSFGESSLSEVTKIEKLSHSIEDMLSENIEITLLKEKGNLSSKQKESAIKILFENGIFNIKGAIPIVADYLKMSVPSVYRYLKKYRD